MPIAAKVFEDSGFENQRAVERGFQNFHAGLMFRMLDQYSIG